MSETQKFTGWMEGVKADDYCFSCGTPLHDVWVMPNGEKRVIAHIENSIRCHEIQEVNEAFLNK